LPSSKQLNLWLWDPLCPRFQTNLVWGLRCLHAIVHLPSQLEGLGATGISVGFELAPPAKIIHSLPARGVKMLKTPRQACGAEGLKQDIPAVGMAPTPTRPC